MILKDLHLQNFRSHKDSSYTFGHKINLLYGDNGVGKTNILEGIHFLCLTKSFLASKDQYALRFDTTFFEINGKFIRDDNLNIEAKLIFVANEGKRAFINKAPQSTLAEVIGKFPMVLFSPDDRALTREGPEIRRKFLNNVLSQVKPAYLRDLMQYQRTVAQRNALLLQLKRQRLKYSTELESWNEELVQTGSRIIRQRFRFFQLFKPFLEQAHQKIAAVGEVPTIKYQTLEFDEESEIETVFRKKLGRLQNSEIDMGRSLVGPHRDEIIFMMNKLEIRRFASHGQHRTFGLTLQLAKYFFLEEQMNEKPLLLLDDIFGDLDAKRSKIFLDLLHSEQIGQCIITAVEEKTFSAVVSFGDTENQRFHITHRLNT
ncbi:MAG: DNA replication and repair protein RecF [Rhodothermia bacterium]|nr:DNA replication and repair protein RecF [Rhodothermia bacterium]